MGVIYQNPVKLLLFHPIAKIRQNIKILKISYQTNDPSCVRDGFSSWPNSTGTHFFYSSSKHCQNFGKFVVVSYKQASGLIIFVCLIRRNIKIFLLPNTHAPQTEGFASGGFLHSNSTPRASKFVQIFPKCCKICCLFL
mgnify:CR=1 FL=1